MYPAPLEYVRAESVDEAIRLLGERDGAKLLAGGHSLIPMMKLRLAAPTAVIDIGRIAELKGVCPTDGGLTVGALTTHAEITRSRELRERCPLLPEAAARIGDPAVRNKGTLGGNIAHADPASDLPAVLVALRADVHLQGPGGRRSVPAADFFVDLLTTALGENEIIVGVELPIHPPVTGSAYLKVEHPASGYAVCGAAAVVSVEGGRCTAVRLCYNGVTAVPADAVGVTEALVGTSLGNETIDEAVERHLSIDEPLGDTHASGEYRVALARAYGKRALKRARDRALA
ncbi:MAG: xanthine dehydrogenase family protein subunit M [Thermoanaerobaculia bacterium]|nr:xanthine dehydrogenase family protein subunit M [Thermoanaerobaculia bacterium]